MLIIAGYVEMDEEERDAWVAAHESLIARGRGANGCLDLAVSVDALDPKRANLFERWDSQEDLDAWRAIAPAPSMDVEFTGGSVAKYVISSELPAFE